MPRKHPFLTRSNTACTTASDPAAFRGLHAHAPLESPPAGFVIPTKVTPVPLSRSAPRRCLAVLCSLPLLAAGCSGRNACTQFRLVDATSEATRDVSFPIEQFDRRGSLEWKSGYRQLSLRIPYDRLVGRPPTGWAKRAGGKLLLDIELSPVKYEPREPLRGTDRIQVEAMPEQFGLVEYRFGGPAGIVGRALIPARATDFPGLAFLTCPASGISMPVSCTAHINAPHDLRVKVFVPQEELADTRQFVEGAIRVVSQAENARSCDVDN